MVSLECDDGNAYRHLKADAEVERLERVQEVYGLDDSTVHKLRRQTAQYCDCFESQASDSASPATQEHEEGKQSSVANVVVPPRFICNMDDGIDSQTTKEVEDHPVQRKTTEASGAKEFCPWLAAQGKISQATGVEEPAPPTPEATVNETEGSLVVKDVIAPMSVRPVLDNRDQNTRKLRPRQRR